MITVKPNWDKLSQYDQSKYVQQARHLIEYNYLNGDVFELAEIIYYKEKQNESNINQTSRT